MVSSIGNTNQVLIWPSIQVSIFSTDYAIASITWFTFTAIHGVTKVAKVIAFGILVAVMCSICAWITWLADLEDHTEIKSTENIALSLTFSPKIHIHPNQSGKKSLIHGFFLVLDSSTSLSTNYLSCSNLMYYQMEQSIRIPEAHTVVSLVPTDLLLNYS